MTASTAAGATGEENGCGDTGGTGDAKSAVAANAKVRNAAERRDCDAGTGLYFKEAVRRELRALLPGSEVLSGGLRVYTTIDPACRPPRKRRWLNASPRWSARRELSTRKRRTGAANAANATNAANDRTGAAAAGQHRRDRSSHRLREGARRRPQFRGESVRSRASGEASAWIGVQAVRLRERARSGIRAGDDAARSRISRWKRSKGRICRAVSTKPPR